MKNYYRILNVIPASSNADIKKAYIRLAKEYHPDTNPGQNTTKTFQSIQEAYHTLGDQDKRRQYDLNLRLQNAKSSQNKEGNIVHVYRRSARPGFRGYRKAKAESKWHKYAPFLLLVAALPLMYIFWNSSKEIVTAEQIMDLQFRHITHVPQGIANSPLIVQLNLSHNKLTELPPDLCTLPSIRLLDLEDNAIKKVSSEIENIPSLVVLNLAHNKINGLPTEISSLRNLLKLNLAYNKLHHLPLCLYELKSLASLNLIGNDIPVSEIEAYRKQMPHVNIHFKSRNNE